MREQLKGFFQGGNQLTLEGRREPGAGIERLHRVEGRRGQGPAAVTGAVEIIVVKNHHAIVGRQGCVELHPCRTLRGRLTERRQSILRRRPWAATMGDDAGEGGQDAYASSP